MTAVISTTYDDQYLFYLPITTWAWNKLGIDVICFVPHYESPSLSVEKYDLISETMWGDAFQMCFFTAPKHKEATYAQCSRLYAAALPWIPDDEALIIGDIDMAVFNKQYFGQYNDGKIHVVGADLVPDFQYPMCYIAMPATKWRMIMDIKNNDTPQIKLDRLLGDLECEHFRGNYWAKDQETIYNHLQFNYLFEDGEGLIKHFRASPGTQFATRRADRDGWPEVIPPDIIDAHLPRPGYTPENFARILNLFQAMYPNEDFTWMIDYRNEYVKLINP